MNSSTDASDSPPRRGWLFVALWVLWTVGLAMNGVLAWQHYLLRSTGAIHGLPGCGEGAIPCQIVLSSAYSRLFGLSITTFGLAYYAAVGASLVVVGYLAKRAPLVPSGLLLPVVCSAGPIAGGWLTFVMMTRIGATCYWCLANHAVNVLLFGTALAFAVSQWRRNRRWRMTRSLPPLSVRPWFVAGAVIVLCGTWQLLMLQPSAESRELRIIPLEWLDNPARSLGFSEESTNVSSISSFKGDRDAPERMVFFTCFTCPYCASINRELNEVLRMHPGKLRVDVRMFPHSPDCNDAQIVKNSPPGHERACEFARIALAVADVDESAFGGYSDWLYEQAPELTGDAALAEAARRVGKEQLESALNSQTIDARLDEDLDLAKKARLITTPQMYLQRGQIGGRLEKGNLLRLLETDFGWPPAS